MKMTPENAGASQAACNAANLIADMDGISPYIKPEKYYMTAVFARVIDKAFENEQANKEGAIHFTIFHDMQWNAPYPKKIIVGDHPLEAIGTGVFPYECTEKEEHPNAMIYASKLGGIQSWTLLHHSSDYVEEVTV